MWCGELNRPQLPLSCSCPLSLSGALSTGWGHLWAAACGQYLAHQEPTMLQMGLASSDN